MSKLQIIEAIRGRNRSAEHEFLNDFDEISLSRYLRHLQHIDRPRNPASAWIRPEETHSIVTRTH